MLVCLVDTLLICISVYGLPLQENPRQGKVHFIRQVARSRSLPRTQMEGQYSLIQVFGGSFMTQIQSSNHVLDPWRKGP
jgi:hypothetical protein